MAPAVSHRPLKAKATVQSKANTFAIACEQSGNGTVYVWLHRISRVSVLPPMLDTHSLIANPVLPQQFTAFVYKEYSNR